MPYEKLVAIIVPMSSRTELTHDEKISLAHLRHFLGSYERFLVVPPGIEYPGMSDFTIKPFGDKYFGSAAAHSKLLLSPLFYKSFSDYKFILIYHLDSLVFSDHLQEWCARDFDYIAPPWIQHRDAPYVGNAAYEGKVGNGGFSLRKIDSFLKVFQSTRYAHGPHQLWQEWRKKDIVTRIFSLPEVFLRHFKWLNDVRRETARFPYNDERFWANRAVHYSPEFRIATVKEALPFAFECVPRYCYEQNDYQLPFGCHAWPQYDRDFWQPFLLDIS